MRERVERVEGRRGRYEVEGGWEGREVKGGMDDVKEAS